MSKAIVVIEIRGAELGYIISSHTARVLSDALLEASDRAEREDRTVFLRPVPEEETVTEKLPDHPPEPEGVVERFSPAAREALDYGDHSPIADAPRVIQDLAGTLYEIEFSPAAGVKVRQAIRLLQQAVEEGP